MEWKESYVQGLPRMDDTHREFVACINRLAAASDEEVVHALEDLLAHTEEHFAQEDRWMEESRFPPIHCHTGEHARVLDSLKQTLAIALQNNPGIGGIIAKELESWFAQHAATMDAALAAHMRRANYSDSPK
ncbi:MAG: hemerythrin domain-containing protein [Betaproteobacteria bacterium]|nr:hemerythrin domain-containing protein [Betaproteobacteria bacterium]